MTPLDLPKITPASVLSACIGGCTNPDLADRIKAVEKTLIATSDQYKQLAEAKTLHLLTRVSEVGSVTKEELKNLYIDQMSNTRGAARSFYNAIRNAPINGKCPLCGVGAVTKLDHHLPKTKYPDIAVCPFNLVPACDHCNDTKKARYPKAAGEQTIHPYYDDFSKEQWIFADLDSIESPVLKFYVKAPDTWSAIDRQRVQRHFDVIKLGVVFTSNANDDMISLRDHLTAIASTKGAAGIQAYLDGERDRYKYKLNGWQHVMYQTLAANHWFVSGGYECIPV